MVLGAVIGTVFSSVLGFLWYHPMFLGTLWMRSTHPGKTVKQFEEECTQAIFISILSSGTLSLLLQCALVNVFHTNSLTEAASIGFGLACLLFLADVAHCAFGKRSFVAFIIDHAYDATMLTIMAVSIVYFNKHGLEFPFLASGSGGKKSGL